MRGNTDAEAVITFRAEDEASEEIKEIREQTEEADKGFAGLSRGLAGTALGFLGLSFGAKALADNFQEVIQSNASVGFSLELLGPAAVQAHDEMSDEFKGIANDVAATEREVSEAFAIIIRNSGGIAPSIAELTGAFDVARLAGIPFEEVAAKIGLALQGNLEPLELLLDPSGRKSIVSLAQALKIAADNADDAISPMDRLNAKFRELGDSLAEIALEDDAPDFFDRLLRSILPVTVAAEALSDALSNPVGDNEDNPILGPLGIEQTPVNLDAVTMGGVGGGVIGIGFTTPLVFNINALQVGSQQQFIDQIIREIQNQLRNSNRDGTNVSDQ